MVVYTGLRLTQQNAERAQTLASQLGVTRNRLFGMLVENAVLQEVKQTLPVTTLPVNNKSTVSNFASVNGAFVESL